MQKKPVQHLSIDQQDSVILRDKESEAICSTSTEMEVVNALRRRALAFDLMKLVPYNTMNGYHAELVEHMSQPPPPGYQAVSIAQVLRADRAAFLLMSEKLSSLKKKADGTNPVATLMENILSHSSVSFHLLPLAKSHPQTRDARPRSRSPKRPSKPSRAKSPRRNKGKGKGKGRGSRGPNVPQGLIGKALQTGAGKRICWAFNLNGCSQAGPGKECPKGLHVCAEPNCEKPHPLSQHPAK